MPREPIAKILDAGVVMSPVGMSAPQALVDDQVSYLVRNTKPPSGGSIEAVNLDNQISGIEPEASVTIQGALSHLHYLEVLK
jgi:hypothetical protein